MTSFLLIVARLCSAMWVGAALLFVLTSVTEQVQESFSTETKDTLALIRFPWYYGTGFCLVGVSFLATVLSSRGKTSGSVATALLAAVLVLMLVDYFFVYRPIRALLLEHQPVRSSAFESLHRWSEIINSVSFLLNLAAAVVLCRPHDAKSRIITANHEVETAA